MGKKYRRRETQTEGLVHMKSPGRYNPRSSDKVRDGLIARERGEFFREGLDWEYWEDDLVLDGYLDGWCETSPDPARPTFQSEAGRTFHSVFTRIRKLSNCPHEVGEYLPRDRKPRSGKRWTERDYRLVNLALNATGVRYGMNRISHIARLLSRGEEEVWEELRRLGRSSEVINDLVRKGESGWRRK